MLKTMYFSIKPFRINWFLPLLGLVLVTSCKSPSQEAPPGRVHQPMTSAGAGNGSDDFVTIDCLLPGQMRRLGTAVTFVTARRPTRTTAEDCAIRGGEYTLADRADYQTSLKLWLDAAQDGDSKSQYYVGTLYEKGPKGTPDYALAAVWYQKAAEQGNRQAAMNLGRLYEQGLGVPKSSPTASKWYAKASGLGQADLSMLMSEESANRIQELEKTLGHKEKEILQLQTHITEITKELTSLRNQLRQQSSEAEIEHQSCMPLKKSMKGCRHWSRRNSLNIHTIKRNFRD